MDWIIFLGIIGTIVILAFKHDSKDINKSYDEWRRNR